MVAGSLPRNRLKATRTNMVNHQCTMPVQGASGTNRPQKEALKLL